MARITFISLNLLVLLIGTAKMNRLISQKNYFDTLNFRLVWSRIIIDSGILSNLRI